MFKTFDLTAIDIQHGLIITGLMMQEITNQITKHFLFIYFLIADIRILHFSWIFAFDVDNESFYHIQSPQKLSLLLWMRPLCVQYILQTNKSSKMYKIYQIYLPKR